jgi:hypothetical protein
MTAAHKKCITMREESYVAARGRKTIFNEGKNFGQELKKYIRVILLDFNTVPHEWTQGKRLYGYHLSGLTK